MTVLIADDEPAIRRLLDNHLEQHGFDVLLTSDGDSAMQIWSADVAVALIDLRMPGTDGRGVLNWARKEYPDVPVVMMAAGGDIRDAVDCMREGAHDFLVKPFDLGELTARIRRAGVVHSLAQRYARLSSAAPSPKSFLTSAGDIPGSSASLLRTLEAVANVDSTVLLVGESGTGKSTAAREIHRLSRRSAGPFVVANCPGFPRDLLESELFGHERGAFTGASKRRLGLVEMAEGGTLFLDEVGDLPMSLQPKLLTFLQDRQFQRLGSSRPLSANVRVMAATNVDLAARVAEKCFREDLFYRLNVIPIEIPPLRERLDTLEHLVKHILTRIATERCKARAAISDAAWELLKLYTWPGNIRELENVLERASLFCVDNTIHPRDLPIPQYGRSNAPEPQVAGLSLKQIEEISLRQTLAMTGGNKVAAARILGVSEKTIYNMLSRVSAGEPSPGGR